jgi:protein gp37
MADHSKIEWTDSTWTPIRARRDFNGMRSGERVPLTHIGWHCEHVSEGCRNCYAEGINRRLGTGLDFKPGHRKDIEIFLDEKMLLAPLKWKKPRMIFVASMTDLFADFVKDEWIDRVFAVMALCPQHRFQVLTKRARRMREYVAQRHSRNEVELAAERIKPSKDFPVSPKWCFEWPLPNTWLGISAEDQPNADERIPDLLQTPAAVRFVSLEPLLGAIAIWPWLHDSDCDLQEHGAAGTCTCSEPREDRVDWVIVGGESGRNARPMHPDWARSIRDQCQAAGVPFFMKQWGEWLIGEPGEEEYLTAFQDGSDFANISDGADIMLDAACEHRGAPNHLWKNYWASGDGHLLKRAGKKAAGRLLDGKRHDRMPT